MKNIKAIGFDIGHTLLNHKKPLNWKESFAPALKQIIEKCGFTDIGDTEITLAIEILMKYNTRENYREHEVTANMIFGEILNAWKKSSDNIETAKDVFFEFLDDGAVYFSDTISTIKELKSRGIKIGFLSDVAYGMDNKYVMKPIESMLSYFDVCLTSIDVGYRKTHTAGFKMLLEKFGVLPSEMLYVGDEEKDVVGANKVGIISVLITRDDQEKNWGQKYTMSSLSEILKIINL